MTDRQSPTAVLHEGPRALSDEQVREIEESDLQDVLKVDIDDVIEYVHKDLKTLPDFTTLYRKYLKQRWDVYDLDFTQDRIDWTEKMTEDGAGVVHRDRVRLPPRRAPGRDRAARVHDRGQRGGEAAHRRPDRGRGAAHRLLRPVLPGGRRPAGRRHHGHPGRVVPVGIGDVRRAVRAAGLPGRRDAPEPLRRARPGPLRHQLLPVDRGRARAVGHEGDAVVRPLARLPARLLHRLHRHLPGRVAARPGRDAVPAGRRPQGPVDDQRDPRHAAHDPVAGRGGQPPRSTTSRWAGPRTRCRCCSSSSCAAS